MKRTLACLLLLAALGCDRRSDLPPTVSLTLSNLEQWVPGPALPPEISVQNANNNLDVIDFGGRLYFVFRTGPTHFASPEVRLHLVSRGSNESWRHETTLFMASDLREPRFFAWKNTLYLYFTQLGTDAASFEPGQMYRVQLDNSGSWSEPTAVFEPGFIPWRFRWHAGRAYMIGYTGGEYIYDFSGKPLTVYLMTTDDGHTWRPVNPARPAVLTGGNSETDIAFDLNGNLYAVARNEAGDAGGFGSRICWAPQSDLSNWSCHTDPKKYDSPLLFREGNEIYLVARRNVTPSGAYDLGSASDKKLTDQLLLYQVDYWTKPKRCSIWRLDKATLTVRHMMDLPSRGDTCFPSILPRGPSRYLLVNYSSPLDGPDRSWMQGQLNPTVIYGVTLSFGY